MKRKIVNIVLMAAMLLNLFGTLTAFADDLDTFEDSFTSATWYENWDGANSVEFTTDTENGRIYPKTSYRVMYAKGISAEKMTVHFTVGGAAGATGGQNAIGVYFENSSNPSDYVYFFFNSSDSNKPYLVADGKEGGTRAFNGLPFSATEQDPQTYIFKLTDDDFTLTKGERTLNFEWPSFFGTYFTDGASYKVGIIAQNCTNNSQVYIDNFEVETVPPFKIEVPDDEIDVYPGAGVLVNVGKMPLLAEPTSANIYLIDGNGETVDTVIEKINNNQYKLKLAENTWLDSGATYKVVVTGLIDTLNQSHELFEKELTAKSYQSDFMIGDISRFTEDSVKEAITSLEAGTYQISAKLFATNLLAQTADIAVMVCEGTETLYRVKEIHYYNDVAAFAEVTPTINVSEGEFLKIMSVDDFTTGKSVTNPVILK